MGHFIALLSHRAKFCWILLSRALVLATQAKEEQAVKRNDSSKLRVGPRNRFEGGDGPINADGTPRDGKQIAVDARKLLRISSLCHFLFLEDEVLAGALTLSIVQVCPHNFDRVFLVLLLTFSLLIFQCLEYPDAYTCRRCTRTCHRIIETVSWSPRYTPLLVNQMFLVAAKNIVTEPKWLVGLEWEMINLLRDLYCRLVLGQTLQPGGQGPGLQQPKDQSNPMHFEQAKFADKPLQGGGILVEPSNLPRQILASLHGLDVNAVEELEHSMIRKRSAKDQVRAMSWRCLARARQSSSTPYAVHQSKCFQPQKDVLRDLLRVAAEQSAQLDGGRGNGVFDRAVKEESLLGQKFGKVAVPDIPEVLVTQSMMNKEAAKNKPDSPEGLAAFSDLY